MNRSVEKSRWIVLALAALALAALTGAGVAQGALERKGNVIVAFNGGIAPIKLPRAKETPVSVQIGGRVRTADQSEPPKLTRITLDINRHGKISFKGLPRCGLGKLAASDSNQAKRACKRSLVGRGNVTSRITLPGQGTFASNGRLYAFFGRVKGRPGILAHVHGSRPLALTFVMQFQIRKAKGRFGTRLVAKMPSIAAGHGRISAFSITLSRRYRARGKKRSFVTASCPAPPGFPSATFDFGRAEYVFDNGTKLRSVLSKQCRVRR